MAMSYTRRDAEKILEVASFRSNGTWGPRAQAHDPYGGNLLVVDEKGVWPDENIDQFELRWKPCWELLDGPDAPDAGATPGLPFDFTAEQLAAFMLSGVGALVAAEFGEWGQPVRLDALAHPDLNRAREAVQGAFDAFQKAQAAVGEVPADRDGSLFRAVNECDAALQAAREKHLCASRAGLSHDEFYRRLDMAKAEPAVMRSESRREVLQAQHTSALAAWRKAMVCNLFDMPTAVEGIGGRMLPVQRAAAQDEVILSAIRSFGHDPLNVPKWNPGRAGVKSSIRAALVGKHPLFQKGSTVFDKTWDRLRRQGEINDQS